MRASARGVAIISPRQQQKPQRVRGYVLAPLVAVVLIGSWIPGRAQPQPAIPGAPAAPPAMAGPLTPRPDAAAEPAPSGSDVSVRVVDGAGAPLAGVPVELLVLPPGEQKPARRLPATTDPQGVAAFEGVTAGPGERIVARASDGDIEYSSPPSALLPGLRLDVRRFHATHDLSGLRILRLETEIDLWEESLIVSQQILLVNRGEQTVDLRQRTAGRAGALYLPLPSAAKSVNVRGSDTSVHEGRIRFAGVVRPGEENALRLAARYHYPVSGDPATLEFPLGLLVEDALTVVPRRPTVMGRDLGGVELRVVAHGQQVFDEQRDRSGRPVWVGRGAPEAGAKSLRVVIAGVPHRSLAPAVAAVVLATLLLLGGVGLRVRRAGGAAADRAAERADLVAELAALDAHALRQPGSAEGLQSRREQLMRRVVALDATAPPP